MWKFYFHTFWFSFVKQKVFKVFYKIKILNPVLSLSCSQKTKKQEKNIAPVSVIIKLDKLIHSVGFIEYNWMLFKVNNNDIKLQMIPTIETKRNQL